MRKIFLLLLISFGVVASAQTAKDFFNRASKKYQDKEYAGAAVEYTRALELSPESAVLFNNRGLCYYKLEQWDKAKDDYDRAVTLDPEYKQAFLNLGNVFLDKAEYDNAVLSFDKALAIDSFYTPVYAKKAYVLYQLEDYKSAAEFYEKAIEYAPVERATLFNARGATYAKLGKNELAIADYDKTLSITPDAYETYINRGILKTKMQKYEAAIQDFTVAQSFAGMSGEGYYYRGLCRVGQLDAIRGTKEKHLVMDIKKNNQLLELACSDFEKAKNFSYGRAFEAYQEYCVEKDEDVVAVEAPKVEKIDSNLKVEYDTVAIVKTTAEPREPQITELSEVSYTLTATERESLKAEIKAEIISELLAEYEMVPREKITEADTSLPLVIDLSSIVSDYANVVDSNVGDSTPIDIAAVEEVTNKNEKQYIEFSNELLRQVNFLDSTEGWNRFGEVVDHDSTWSTSEGSGWEYALTDTFEYYQYGVFAESQKWVDYYYLKNGEVLMYRKVNTRYGAPFGYNKEEAYAAGDSTIYGEPKTYEELVIFENGSIVFHKKPDFTGINIPESTSASSEQISEEVSVIRSLITNQE